MKKIFYILAAILIHSILLWAFDKVYIEKTRNFKIINNLKIQLSSVRTVFIGDSHCNFGINPAIVSASFNLCFPGSSYIQAFSVLNDVLKSPHHLEQIVIEVDDHMFSQYKLESLGHDHWFWARFINFKALAVEHGFWSLYFRSFIAGHLFPYASSGADIVANTYKIIRNKGFETPLAGGFIIKDGYFDRIPQVQQQKMSHKRASGHFGENQAIYHPILINYFKKILDLAERKKIKTILLDFPTTNLYRKEKSRYLTKSLLDHKKELMGQAPLIDANDLRWHNSDFRDADHLNTQGSNKLSDFVAKRLQEI